MLDLSYRMAHKAVFHVELSSSLPSAQLLDMIQGLIHDYVWNEFGCAPEWPRFRGSCQMESPDKRVIIQTAFLKDEQSDEIKWAVRIKNQDNCVKRRNWLTHIGILMETPQSATVYFAQMYHDHLAGSFAASKPIDSIPPRLYVKFLTSKRLCCKTGATSLTTDANSVNHEQMEKFITLAQDRNRHLPILLISCPDLLDPELAARKLLGNLMVYWLDDFQLLEEINRSLAPDVYITWDSVQVILPFEDKPQEQHHPVFYASDMTRLGAIQALNMLYRAFCTALRANDRRDFVTVDSLYRNNERKAWGLMQERVKTLAADKKALVEKNEQMTEALTNLSKEYNRLADEKLQQENNTLEQLLDEAIAKRDCLQSGLTDLTQRLYASMGKEFSPVSEGETVLCELEHAIYVCFSRLAMNQHS